MSLRESETGQDLMDGETSKENSCRDIVDSRISDKIYYLALSQRNLALSDSSLMKNKQL